MQGFLAQICIGLLLLLTLATCDVYMHAPRGSNDRNCEKNVNRNNGNRLFDSQNNAKGGYACPRPRAGPEVNVDRMYYHPGSKVVVEWTNQHGCGTNPKTSCEIVIQYACEDTLDAGQKYRDGTSIGAPRDGTPRDADDAATDTIPETEAAATADTVETRRFGMHENNEYYQKCKQRSRNKGLFTADQRVNRHGSTGTRQNPNGNRRGLECPEERDYYPYWAPTPWRDVAVITSNPQRCDYHKQASHNVAGSGECEPAEEFYEPDHLYQYKCRRDVSRDTITAVQRKQRQEWYNNQKQCEAVGHVWAPTWWDARHPESVQARADMQDQAVVGRMNYQVWDGVPAELLCNTQENAAIEKKAPVENVLLSKSGPAGWKEIEAGSWTKVFEQNNCDVMKDLGKSAVDAMFAKDGVFRYDVDGVPYAYYKRLTDTTGVSIYDNMVGTWSVRTGNEFNVDFKLYSNLSSTEADSNAWRFCNGDHATIGFPRDCGPITAVGSRWAASSSSRPCGSARTVAFHILRTADSLSTPAQFKSNVATVVKSGEITTTQQFKAPIKVEFEFMQEGKDSGCIQGSVLGTVFGFNGGYSKGRGQTPGTGYAYVQQPHNASTRHRELAIADAMHRADSKITGEEPGCYVKLPTGCKDHADTYIPGNTSLTTGCGAAVCSYYYTGISGSAVNELTSNAKFPDKPDETKAIESGNFELLTYGDNYGAMLEGWVKAPATGNYVFLTNSDDSSEVWVGAAADDNKDLTKAVELVGCCRTITGTVQFSFVKGQSYYVKALLKEGGGGDYLEVGMKQGETTYMPIPVSMFDTDVGAGALSGNTRPTVQRLSGFFVPTITAAFKFSSKAGFGSELWLDSTKLATNEDATGKRVHQAKPVTLTKNKAYKLQAFGIALAEGVDGALDIGVTVSASQNPVQAGGTYEPMRTATPHFKICSTEDCTDKPRSTQCQTAATAECECDSWAARAPADWRLTEAAGNCCMRPVYQPEDAPWCYCKGVTEGEGATSKCDPKLAPNKGSVMLEQSVDAWSETVPVAMMVEESATATVKSPTVDCVDGYHSTSRENQLGNARDTANPDPAIPHGINANRYIWSVPEHVQDNCVLRLRYNISSSDYPSWANDGTPLTTHTSNSYERNGGFFGPDGSATTSPVMQDPYIGFGADPNATFLELALNTNQYGRTFQDRSYVFDIKPQPKDLTEGAKIYNVNVRGKRGNIVQTYPAVEYDFVPNDLCLQENDYVHFQWTGSDYNPQRNPNDGAGAGDDVGADNNQASRADRSNLVEMDTLQRRNLAPVAARQNNAGPFPESQFQTHAGKRSAEVASGMNYPAGSVQAWASLDTNYNGMFWTADNKPDQATIMKLAFIDQVERLKAKNEKCKTLTELLAEGNEGRRERDPQNCAKLNGAREPYFDGGLVQMRKPGKFAYFSSRNNNFSNRDHKGFVCVGKGQCTTGKGCQATVEDELRELQKSEATDGTKLLQVEQQSPPKECDADCKIAKLELLVHNLRTEIKSLKDE